MCAAAGVQRDWRSSWLPWSPTAHRAPSPAPRPRPPRFRSFLKLQARFSWRGTQVLAVMCPPEPRALGCSGVLGGTLAATAPRETPSGHVASPNVTGTSEPLGWRWRTGFCGNPSLGPCYGSCRGPDEAMTEGPPAPFRQSPVTEPRGPTLAASHLSERPVPLQGSPRSRHARLLGPGEASPLAQAWKVQEK